VDELALSVDCLSKEKYKQAEALNRKLFDFLLLIDNKLLCNAAQFL
jgi:hypothetical protein